MSQKFQDEGYNCEMEKSTTAVTGIQPPPYSSLVASHGQYVIGSPGILPTAPYPVTPDSGHMTYSIPAPPPYNYNLMQVGMSGNEVTPQQSNLHASYNPGIYNLPITESQITQQRIFPQKDKSLWMRVIMMLVIIVILIMIGIGIDYYVQEVF